ncbi:MAG: acylphosphatase [Candidatus Binatia bacterium]
MKEEDREDQSRVRLCIEGRVQGVFFRYSTVEEAGRLGLRGWVRNCPDGSVEVMAEGPRENIENLISWCRHGPPGAHVHNVRIQWENYKGEFANFHIRR